MTPALAPSGTALCDLRLERGVSGEGARVGVEVGTGRLRGEASLSRLWRGRAASSRRVLSGLWVWSPAQVAPGSTGTWVGEAARPLRGPGWSFRGRGCPRSCRGARAGPPVCTEPVSPRVPPPSLGQTPRCLPASCSHPPPLPRDSCVQSVLRPGVLFTPRQSAALIPPDPESRPPPAVGPAPCVLRFSQASPAHPRSPAPGPSLRSKAGPPSLAASGPMPALLGRGSPAGPPLPTGQPSE